LLDGEEEVVHKEHHDHKEDLHQDENNEDGKSKQNGAINYSLQDKAEKKTNGNIKQEPKRTTSLSDHVRDDHFSEHSLDVEEDDESNKGDFLKQKSSLRLSFEKTKHKIVWSMVKVRGFLHKSVSPEESWKEMNIFQKVIYLIIDLPFDFLRRVTIPPG
jgi:hypothetical protein